MPYSNNEPTEILIDSVQNGIATIRVRWDIAATTKLTPDEHEYIEWVYSENRMEWVLPEVYENREAVQTYLDANYSTGENILNWAKASKINL
jgi:hypothetical protein